MVGLFLESLFWCWGSDCCSSSCLINEKNHVTLAVKCELNIFQKEKTKHYDHAQVSWFNLTPELVNVNDFELTSYHRHDFFLILSLGNDSPTFSTHLMASLSVLHDLGRANHTLTATSMSFELIKKYINDGIVNFQLSRFTTLHEHSCGPRI